MVGIAIPPPLQLIEVHFGVTRTRLVLFVTEQMMSSFAKQLSEDDKSLFIEVRSAHGHMYMIRRAAITRVVTDLQPSHDGFAQVVQPPVAGQIVLHFADGTSQPFSTDTPYTVAQYMVDLAAARTPDAFCAVTGQAGKLLIVPVRELDVLVASRASIDAALASQDPKASSSKTMRRFTTMFDGLSDSGAPRHGEPLLPGEKRPHSNKPPRKPS